MNFSPLFGVEKECWQCRHVHPEFLPCHLNVQNCIGCHTPLLSLERWQTQDSRGKVWGPLCECCFRRIDPEWFIAFPLCLPNPAYMDAPFEQAVWTPETGHYLDQTPPKFEQMVDALPWRPIVGDAPSKIRITRR